MLHYLFVIESNVLSLRMVVVVRNQDVNGYTYEHKHEYEYTRETLKKDIQHSV